MTTTPNTTPNTTRRYPVTELSTLVQALFCATGMDAAIARCVTDALITADCMGHSTHGLALAPWYLDAARTGAMTTCGDKTVVNDRGGCITWNGNRLPGAWLINQAIDVALERIEQHGVVTVAIANSHHTGALAVYLPRLTERGLLVQLVNSSPSAAGVAPYGGTQPVFTPNPLAAGIPTSAEPVLLDISASITTLNSAKQLVARGEKFPAMWAMDAQGNPTNDPAAVIGGGGSLLPTGGMDHGHKGYAMAILAEALTQGLPGYGRVDAPKNATVGIYLQVTDPGAFAGQAAFVRQTDWLVNACRNNPPRSGVAKVRLPGEHALVRQREARSLGVPLIEAVMDALRPLAEQAGLHWPQAMAS